MKIPEPDQTKSKEISRHWWFINQLTKPWTMDSLNTTNNIFANFANEVMIFNDDITSGIEHKIRFFNFIKRLFW